MPWSDEARNAVIEARRFAREREERLRVAGQVALLLIIVISLMSGGIIGYAIGRLT